MKKFKLLFAIILSVSLFSCSCKQKEETQSVINSISVEDLSAASNKIQLLDVRTPEEYEGGYIKNAININFFDDDFVNQVSSKFDKNKPIFLYCKVGGRSGKASKKLKEAGFKNIFDLEGGFDKWKSSLKTVTQNK